MTQILTPGRWRRLRATSMPENIFAIMAFDQRDSYRKMLPEDASYETAAEIKKEVIVSLSQHASAVLTDPYYGLASVMHMSGQSGLLMALEESGYSGDSTYRRVSFIDSWTIDKIQKFGASAIKLLVYYHPETGELAEELEAMVSDILKEAHAVDMPVFLEPMSYSLDENAPKGSAAFAQTKPEVVRETARRLGALGPDVLKLEFPVDAAHNTDHGLWKESCEAITDVSPVPWVLLSAGVNFETFEEQTRVACRAGASGWLAGRAIWKESIPLSPAERASFLATTAAERTQKLIDIARSEATPWSDIYAAPTGDSDWYNDYM